jgi:hypothetical protein
MFERMFSRMPFSITSPLYDPVPPQHFAASMEAVLVAVACAPTRPMPLMMAVSRAAFAADKFADARLLT